MGDTLLLPPDTKAIPLNKGHIALVDADDYDCLSQWKWHISAKGYARRTVIIDGKSRGISMHRQIMNTPDGMFTDHIDGDKLNNRRSNLRICTPEQNGFNLGPRRGTRSQYKGVTWHKRSGKWQARVKFENQILHLGLFENEIDAAAAYNECALRCFGDFARLNPVPEGWVITTRNVPKRFNNIRIGKQGRGFSSQYKGVARVGNRWVARIKTEGTIRHLGTFDSEDRAALAYNAAAREAWGEIAWLNPVACLSA
ncbi:MAG: HNH endonuclease [Planctomycetes bacterium]|nr:HNH endonuclease [Planctomycetota bacterium]